MKTAILLSVVVFGVILDEHYAHAMPTAQSTSTVSSAQVCHVDDCVRCQSGQVYKCAECKEDFAKIKIYSSLQCTKYCPKALYKVFNQETKEYKCKRLPPSPETCRVKNCKRCITERDCHECNKYFARVKVYGLSKCLDKCPQGTRMVFVSAQNEYQCERLPPTVSTTDAMVSTTNAIVPSTEETGSTTEQATAPTMEADFGGADSAGAN